MAANVHILYVRLTAWDGLSSLTPEGWRFWRAGEYYLRNATPSEPLHFTLNVGLPDIYDVALKQGAFLGEVVMFERYARYRATIKIRRGPGRVVRPEAEALDGKRLLLEAAWPITEEDRPDYAGEWAMTAVRDDGQEPLPCGWVASGDLVGVARQEDG